MNTDIIMNKARDYLTAEQNPVFRDQVRDLIEQNNLEDRKSVV